MSAASAAVTADMATIRFESAVPQFTVSDVVRTAEYYRDVLGFQVAGYWDGERVGPVGDGRSVFAIVRRDDVQLFFVRGDSFSAVRGRMPAARDVFLQITGVDALATELRARGAEILEGPEDQIYQQRELVVRDCNGFVLAFGEDTAQRAT